jgi:uncharacterized protein YjbI with pentapeptide repeats
VDFTDCDLRWADLAGSNLVMTKFDNANLWEADLYAVQGAAASFKNANLRGANLCEAKFNSLVLMETKPGNPFQQFPTTRPTNFSRADMNRAKMCEADMSGAIFDSTNMSWSKLCETRLVQAILDNADLRQANLQEANLQHASVANARFGGARLYEANMEMVLGMKQAFFKGALFYKTTGVPFAIRWLPRWQ